MYLLYCYYAFIDSYMVILTTKLTNCQTSRNQISGAQSQEWGTSGPRHLDPRHLDPRHLDPRYCTVYNTVEAGVQMSNFGNKVGHLDPRHLDPWYSTVYKTVETGVQMSNFGNKVGHLDPC